MPCVSSRLQLCVQNYDHLPPPPTHTFLKRRFLTDFEKHTHTPPKVTTFWCIGPKFEKILKTRENAPCLVGNGCPREIWAHHYQDKVCCMSALNGLDVLCEVGGGLAQGLGIRWGGGGDDPEGAGFYSGVVFLSSNGVVLSLVKGEIKPPRVVVGVVLSPIGGWFYRRNHIALGVEGAGSKHARGTATGGGGGIQTATAPTQVPPPLRSTAGGHR